MRKCLNNKGSITVIIIIVASVLALGGIGTAVYLKNNKKFTVSFGSETIKVEAGNKVKKPKDPKKEGYEFVGWFIGDKEFNFDTEINENIKLTPKYEIKSYTVKFVTNSETIIEDVTVKYKEKVAKPEDPVKNNAEFLGWKSDGTDYDFDNEVKNDLVLEASWNQKFVVKFDSDGGSSIKSQTVAENEKATTPTAPTKNGYKFLGWKLDSKDYDFNTPVDKDITLKASWEKTSTPLTAAKVCSMAKSYLTSNGKSTSNYYFDKCRIEKHKGNYYAAYIAGYREDQESDTDTAALIILEYDGINGKILNFNTSSGYIQGQMPGQEYGLWD